jgi:AAA family ATP:ADP antiporter
MRIFKILTELKARLLEIESDKKLSLGFICLTLFSLYLSYPMVRATSEAFFLNSYGAKKSPLVWLWSVAILCIVIFITNRIQKKVAVHSIYIGTVFFTLLIFLGTTYLMSQGISFAAYPFFVWKEVYIVLLVHMSLAYLNTIIDYKLAKIVYGPLGALASLGGVFGGQLTSYLAKNWSMENIILLGTTIITISAFVFWMSRYKKEVELKVKELSKESPLHSILGVRKYVFGIALIVLLSQFCINLANFKFNLLFSEIVPDKMEKTSYLGQLYSIISILSLVIQLIIIPLLFNLVKNKTIHFAIPVIYIFAAGGGFLLGGHFLLPVAATFVLYKGMDYSLFSAAKEMLYFPLTEKQKYGAKYIVDMIVYRFAKGVISLILIYIQDGSMINAMLFISLMLWMFVLWPLFKTQKNIIKTRQEKELK